MALLQLIQNAPRLKKGEKNIVKSIYDIELLLSKNFKTFHLMNQENFEDWTKWKPTINNNQYHHTILDTFVFDLVVLGFIGRHLTSIPSYCGLYLKNERELFVQ